MVTEVLDQQNAELAKRLFSKRVQRIMERNGDLEEAKFVQLVRQWYKACDEHGLHPNIRVNHWIEMHKFLTSGIHFDDYPMGSTHIKGIPIITYEGLLQGISTRISLYNISQTGTYNNRAISTLGIKSFFSTLSKADFTMTGCPKAMQIHKILPIMMDFQNHKHNLDTIFKIDLQRGAPYPYYNMEKVSFTCNPSSQTQFKQHNFDQYKNTKKELNSIPL